MTERRSRSLRAALTGLVLALAVAAGPCLAGDDAAVLAEHDDALRRRPDSVPDDAALVAAGALVGRIHMRRLDIFDTSDPKENNRLFRGANKLHPRTRETVIRRLLLFDSGERYDPRLLLETERRLRDTRYLYDAWIRPVGWDGSRVDIEVLTRDVWTLGFSLGLSRSGGTNRTRIGIEDSNFLGTGKELTIRRTSDVDRTEQLYRYVDENVFGSRVRIETGFSENSDGRSSRLTLARPFYALDARVAGGGSAFSEDRRDSLYDAGERFDRFRHRRQAAELWAGFSRGRIGRRTVRWSSGFTWKRDRFESIPGRDPAAQLPPDRELAYPWIAAGLIDDAFTTTHDLDRVARTEDLNLGLEAYARLGWSSPSFGGDRGRLIYEARLHRGFRPARSRLVLFDAEAEGRWSGDGAENAVVGGTLRFHQRNLRRHDFFVLLHAAAAENLDPERQLLVGGDSGLRGYPLRFQDGNRRALLTVEQRFFTDWHLFRLVRVGAAVFFDVGRAWFTGPDSPRRPYLKDAGFGLRLGSSRSSRGSLVHIDLAIALDGDPDTPKTQLLINSRETF